MLSLDDFIDEFIELIELDDHEMAEISIELLAGGFDRCWPTSWCNFRSKSSVE